MLPLERQVDIVARLTERSRTYFDLYKFIEGADYRPRILDQMNDYIGYFYLQGHVLRYALVVELGALFEKKKDSVCLHALLGRAKSKIPNQKYLELSTELNSAQDSARKISKLRNKAFAHRDVYTDFDEVFREASITLDDIEALIEVSRRFIDELCCIFNVRKVLFVTLQTQEDCRRLFRQLGSKV